MDFTKAEMMISCISREIVDGDWVSQGIATPLVNSALMLACLTHAPNVVFYYSVGNTVSMESGPISLSNFEKLTIEKALKHLTFEELTLDLNRKVRPKEFFRPAQLDPYGNFNNVVIGPYGSPRLKLPGAVGIPEVTEYFHDFYLYVPRHEPRCFTERVDFLSGLGYMKGQSDEERREMGITGTGPKKVITDLGVFSFDAHRKLQVESLHPGVTSAEVAAKTGFSLEFPSSIPVTQQPSVDELNLIRHEIDPLSIRDLEMLDRQRRIAKVMEVFTQEQSLDEA
jgi:glutaconate CoA-transferase subunit B